MTRKQGTLEELIRNLAVVRPGLLTGPLTLVRIDLLSVSDLWENPIDQPKMIPTP